MNIKYLNSTVLVLLTSVTTLTAENYVGMIDTEESTHKTEAKSSGLFLRVGAMVGGGTMFDIATVEDYYYGGTYSGSDSYSMSLKGMEFSIGGDFTKDGEKGSRIFATIKSGTDKIEKFSAGFTQVGLGIESYIGGTKRTLSLWYIDIFWIY